MSVRIMSLKLNKLILYGALALAAVILAVVLLISLNRPGTPEASKDSLYYPGVYSTSMVFGTQVLTMEMTFSETAITSVSCHIPESVQTVYPLVAPTVSSMGSQLQKGIDLDSVTLDGTSLETGAYLKEAMAATIKKALRK